MITLVRQMEMVKLTEKLNEAKQLVVECAKLPNWNVWKRHTYCQRLVAVDSELQRLMQMHTQIDICVDVRKALQQTRVIHKKLNALGEEANGSKAQEPAKREFATECSESREGGKPRNGVEGGTPAKQQESTELLQERVAYLERAIREKKAQVSRAHQLDLLDYGSRTPRLVEFSVHDLMEATERFHDDSEISIGESAKIYKGRLYCTTVAIKRLNPTRADSKKAFEKEVEILSRVVHPNFVQLLGVCNNRKYLCLVLEWIPNGTLKDHLHGEGGRPPLCWQARLRIAAEVCSALFWLQSMTPWSVFHGDIKPSNILLDDKLSSKLCDFGISHIARDLPYTDGGVMYLDDSPVRGTLGYIDGSYTLNGRYTSKSDLYGLGVVLMQLLTGVSYPIVSSSTMDEKWRRLHAEIGIQDEYGSPLHEEMSIRDQYHPYFLVEMVKWAKSEGKGAHLIDPTAGAWPLDDALLLVDLGLQCCQEDPRDRPNLETLWDAFRRYCDC